MKHVLMEEIDSFLNEEEFENWVKEKLLKLDEY